MLEEREINCPVCQKKCSFSIQDSDLIIKGKNIKCDFCGAVLWLAFEFCGPEIKIRPELPFSLLAVVKDPNLMVH